MLKRPRLCANIGEKQLLPPFPGMGHSICPCTALQGTIKDPVTKAPYSTSLNRFYEKNHWFPVDSLYCHINGLL
jgi:hypothetical protein